MKLYATTTSERASKGQGGNKMLVIDIKGQELEGIPQRENLFKIVLEAEEGRLRAKVWDYTEKDEIILYPRHASTPPKMCDCYRWRKEGVHDIDCETRKGKQQKGE
jgi:hypothetical protein